MRTTQLLTDAFARIEATARRTLEGLDADALAYRPDDEANPIGWLLWHTARVQDDHVAEVAEREQVWHDQDWPGRFDLADDSMDTGFGHGPDEVAAVHPDGTDALIDYLAQVSERTRGFLERLDDDDLDRVVDESWDPVVTLGVRLTSVVSDSLQHLGQAGYVRGLWERRT
jgi:hypothetical protein